MGTFVQKDLLRWKKFRETISGCGLRKASSIFPSVSEADSLDRNMSGSGQVSCCLKRSPYKTGLC